VRRDAFKVVIHHDPLEMPANKALCGTETLVARARHVSIENGIVKAQEETVQLSQDHVCVITGRSSERRSL
jgi:hypothetical protein